MAFSGLSPRGNALNSPQELAGDTLGVVPDASTPTHHGSQSLASARALNNYLAKSSASIERIKSYRDMYGEILKGLDE